MCRSTSQGGRRCSGSSCDDSRRARQRAYQARLRVADRADRERPESVPAGHLREDHLLAQGFPAEWVSVISSRSGGGEWMDPGTLDAEERRAALMGTPAPAEAAGEAPTVEALRPPGMPADIPAGFIAHADLRARGWNPDELSAMRKGGGGQRTAEKIGAQDSPWWYDPAVIAEAESDPEAVEARAQRIVQAQADQEERAQRYAEEQKRRATNARRAERRRELAEERRVAKEQAERDFWANSTSVGFPYDEGLKDRIKAAGGRWEPATRTWRIPNDAPELAEAQAAHEAGAKAKREAEAAAQAKRAAARQAFLDTSTSLSIPYEARAIREAAKAAGAEWEPDSKTWRVPNDEADAIRALLDGHRAAGQAAIVERATKLLDGSQYRATGQPATQTEDVRSGRHWTPPTVGSVVKLSYGGGTVVVVSEPRSEVLDEGTIEVEDLVLMEPGDLRYTWTAVPVEHV